MTHWVPTLCEAHAWYVYVVQTLNCVQLFMIPWTAAYQTPLSFTISRSLLKFMSIESVMLSNYLILCYLFLPFPSIFPSIRGFSKWVGSSYQVGKFMHIISNPPHNPVKLFPLSLLYKGEGNGNPLQYSYLENPMDRGVWQAYNPWGHEESDMTEWLHFTYITKEEMHSKTFPSKLSIKSDSQQHNGASDPLRARPHVPSTLPPSVLGTSLAFIMMEYAGVWWTKPVQITVPPTRPARLGCSSEEWPFPALHPSPSSTEKNKTWSVSGWCLLYLSKRDFPQQTPH